MAASLAVPLWGGLGPQSGRSHGSYLGRCLGMHGSRSGCMISMHRFAHAAGRIRSLSPCHMAVG